MDSPLDIKLDIPPTTEEWMATESVNDWIGKATQTLQDIKRKAMSIQEGDTSKCIENENDHGDNESMVGLDLSELSGTTTDTLLQTLRRHGLNWTLQLVTEGNNVINQDTVEPIALDKISQNIYLDDHDLYIVWMSIVYHYIFDTAPESIMRRYANIAAGKGASNKPMFTINWAAAVAESPLTRSEQIGTANLLLSMVRLFGKKARGNHTKRPLLMGVWHTLLNFLAHIECYKKAGTLTLLRKGLDVEALAPEIYDTAAELEIQLKGRAAAIQHLQQYAKKLPVRIKLIIAYRCARSLEPNESSTQEELCEAARLVALPMKDLYDIKHDEPFGTGNVQVDFIRRLYLSALGMDPTPPAPAKPAYQKGFVKSSTFGWINLLFLTQISLWMYTNPALQSTLLQQLKTARDMAMDAVRSEDAKLLIFKYCKNQINA